MNYGTSTRFSSEQVLGLAEQFFGPAGLGLAVTAHGRDTIELAGRQGQVRVKARATDGSTEVFLTTRGLDYQVRQFMVEIYEEAHLHAE